MKKKLIIIGSVLLFLILVVFFCYQNDNIRFKISYGYINYIEYSNGKKIKVDIPFDNKIHYLNEKDVIEFLTSGTGLIYFGYNTCPWCRNSVPILIEAAKENNLNTIYYADVHKLNIKSIRKELYGKLDSYLEENDEGNKVLGVPHIFSVKNGKILGNHVGTVDSYHNPYQKMTEEEKEELLTIYKDLIMEMNKDE